MKTMIRIPGSTALANMPPSPNQYMGSMKPGRAIKVVVMRH